MKKNSKIKHLDGYDLPIGDVFLGLGVLLFCAAAACLLIVSLIF